MYRSDKLHIIVPAHNEEANLAKCITSLRYLYPQATITIAEDGSIDRTVEIARKLLLLKNVFLQSYPQRIGKGEAIRLALLRGYQNAFYDADMAVSPYAIGLMSNILNGNDGLVLAWRIALNRSLIRTITSKIYNSLVRLLFDTKINDHQCGCKLLSSKATEIALNTTAKGFFFDTELIVKCKQAKIPITELTVPWVETKKQSSVNVARDSLRMLKQLFLLRLKN